MPASDTPICIIGAGPVGLTAACELQRSGTPVRIVDRRQRPEEAVPVSPGARPGTNPQRRQSKAIIVWPRTLEVLAGIGLAGRCIEAGHCVQGVRFHADGRHLAAVRMTAIRDSPYNTLLMLPQWRTEALLRESFERMGGSIEWGTELLGLEPTAPSGASISLRHPGGGVEATWSRWVIGADGAQSKVRMELGIKPLKMSQSLSFAIADVELAGPIDRTALHYYYSRRGALGVGPLGGTTCRLALNVAPGTEPTAALLQEALDQRTGTGARITDIQWSTIFTLKALLAERFQRGSVFLCGDAAHVVSPAGGQGLNTGMHDASNLAWKIVAVEAGHAPDRLLDTYSEERYAAVERISRITDRQTRWGLIEHSGPRMLRNISVRGLGRGGILEKTTAPMLAQTDGVYGKARAFDILRYPRIRRGGRLPYVAHQAGRGIAESKSLTLFVSTDSGAEALYGTGGGPLDSFVAGLPPWVDVRALRPNGDSSEAKLVHLAGSRAAMILVRPDGHVLATGTCAKPSAVSEAIARFARGYVEKTDSSPIQEAI